MYKRQDYYDGKDYLELHALFQNSLKLFVSAEEAHLPTLRPVMTKKEALALVDSIADADGIDESSFELGANTPTVLERRVREEYDRRLKTFAPEDLVPIMKSVHERTARREGCLLYTSKPGRLQLRVLFRIHRLQPFVGGLFAGDLHRHCLLYTSRCV